MSFEINHTTTDETIRRATKAELYAALGIQPRRGELKERVQRLAISHRNVMIENHEEEEAERKRVRNETLAREDQDEQWQAIKRHAVELVTKQQKKHEANLDTFRKKVAEGQCIVDLLRWDAEDVMYQEFCWKRLRSLEELLVKEASSERELTCDELLKILVASAKHDKQGVFRDGYRHNSTGAITNIQNIQEHKALQSMFAFQVALIEWFRDVLREPHYVHVRSLCWDMWRINDDVLYEILK